MALSLTSPAFPDGGEIPARFTCDGADVSPPLQWSGLPAGARSLVLLVRDPDCPDPAAPQSTWVHWVLYDLPAHAGGVDEGAPPPQGARRGRNDWERTGYGGPCPPIGRHRYRFEMFALDTILGDRDEPVSGALLEAMEGHVLEQALLVATYERHR
jgi:hypothetical protein